MAVHEYKELDVTIQDELRAVAQSIVVPGKGILAMDDFNDGIGANLAKVSQENTPENRRLYRQAILTSPDIEKYVSGVILFDETVRQSVDSGVTIPQHLKSLGIHAGAKVDCDVVSLEGGQDGELSTQGLDDLAKRAREYKQLGCTFVKWRNALQITSNCPSSLAVADTAYLQARYARVCQEAGLVPIVEPDISNSGSHDLQTCKRATEKVLAAVFKALNDHNVYLEGILLKPNFVTAGLQGPSVTPEQVGQATISAFRRTVPAAVAGCCFLSGGLGEENGALYLNAVNTFKGNSPWALTYSYGRALQDSAWKAYGKERDVKGAQEKFLDRLKACSDASQGKLAK